MDLALEKSCLQCLQGCINKVIFNPVYYDADIGTKTEKEQVEFKQSIFTKVELNAGRKMVDSTGRPICK